MMMLPVVSFWLLGCETDRSQNVMTTPRELCRSIAELALANKPADKDALMNLDLNGMTVANAISEQVGKIGEKIK